MTPPSNLMVSSPNKILIELTNQCNLLCVTCARNDRHGQEMTKGRMPLETFKRVFDQISGSVNEVVLIGLGELLLYTDLVSAVEYMASINPHIKLFLATNGTVPNSASILDTVCHTLPTSVMISIDGVGETFNKVRKKASFEVFTEKVKEIVCSESAVNYSFNMVVFDQNYHDMTNVVDFCHNVGVKKLFVNTLNLAALPSVPVEAYHFYNTSKFKSELREARSRAHYLGVSFDCFDFEGERGFRSCQYPWTDFYITWDGYLAQCCAQPFPKIKNYGNVLDVGIDKAINGRDFVELRRKWFLNEAPDLCARCHKVCLPVTAGTEPVSEGVS